MGLLQVEIGGELLMSDRHTTRFLLERTFGKSVRSGVPMTQLTTFRIGGLADWFLEVNRSDDLVAAVRLTVDHDLPLTVLGGGSNVLVADAGVRGLVLRLRHGVVSRIGSDRIRAESGVTMNGLVRWTIQRGLAGLESWAGTPGSVGGAIYGNAHFEGRLLGDVVTRVGLVDSTGVVSSVSRDAMRFGYDDSRVRHTGERVLWAEFAVAAGDLAILRAVARKSLGFRKRTQPLGCASAGCIFQNPCPEDGLMPRDMPSAGALIDQAGLKGRRVGGAVVSPVHGNFIVNEGGATSRDVRCLIESCRAAVADRFGIALRDELIYLGDFGEKAEVR